MELCGRRAAALLGSVALATIFAAPIFAVESAWAQTATAEQLTQDAAAAAATKNDGAAPADGKADNTTWLDKVTVVSRTGETAIDTMASVSHVEGEQLERRMSTTPADALFGVPGVTVQTDSKRVATSFNIRGLQDFGRVAVIVDGARQDFQRSGHGTQSTAFIDPELIEEIDVLRGPVANTYGSGAIGGVVFIDTKDAEDFLRPDETWATSLTGRYETNGRGWTTSATGAARLGDSASVLGNIVYRDYGDYKDGGGDTVAGTGFDVLSGMLKGTIRPTDNSELKLGWVGSSDNWQEGTDDYALGLKQNTFTARYSITDPDRTWLDLHVNASFNHSDLTQDYLSDHAQFDPDSGDAIVIPKGSRTEYDLQTWGIDIWNTSRFETGALSHALTYGGDWLTDDVDTSSPIGGSDFYTPSGRRTVSGAYVQDKFNYSSWLEVEAALRYDSYSLKGTDESTEGDRLSPRITVGISPFSTPSLQGLQFYGTYAEGYRSPSISETLISGLHPEGVTFPFLANPNLVPETAKTWEAGINYKRDGLIDADDTLRLKAAYFNNDVSNFIDGVTIVGSFDPNNPGICPVNFALLMSNPSYIPICYQYQNFASARLNGFEMEAAYDAGRYFIGLSGSITNGYRVADGVREDLTTIPSSQVTAQLGFRRLDRRLTFGGEVQYNGAPDGAVVRKDYTLVNAFASYKVNDNFKLDFRADNIFDVKYANPLNATTTTPLYEPGMTFKIAATMRFGG